MAIANVLKPEIYYISDIMEMTGKSSATLKEAHNYAKRDKGLALPPLSISEPLSDVQVQFFLSKYNIIDSKPKRAKPAKLSFLKTEKETTNTEKEKLKEKSEIEKERIEKEFEEERKLLISEKERIEKESSRAIEEWKERFQIAEAKNMDYEMELSAHLKNKTEREAKVTVLELINYGEIAVAVVGSCIMFHWVGAVIAFPAVLFYYDAMRTVKKSDSWDSAQFAIFICAILSLAFGFVHYNTALKYNDSDAYPKWIVAVFAAILLSGISVAALWQNYLKKNEAQ